jgi:glycerol-3-phosphate dehydrogenase
VLPAANLSGSDIHYAYAGIRPLPRRDKGPESAITRKHIIRHHKKQAKGLFSVLGGKITTYRNLAEQVVDKLARKAATPAGSCKTRSQPMPGAEKLDETHARLCEFEFLSGQCIARMLGIYGSRSLDIALLAREREDLAGLLGSDADILAAEVVFLLQQEFACNLIDIVHRRMMTGLSSDQGESSLADIADIAAIEARWGSREKQSQLTALRQYNRRLRSFDGQSAPAGS